MGRVAKAQGLRGEIFVALKLQEASWLTNLRQINLSPKLSDSVLCFDVQSFRWHRNKGRQGLVIKLKDINDRTQAEAWQGATVWVEQNLLTAEIGEPPYLREILHFRVELNGQVMGPVTGFQFNGTQDLLVIATNSGDLLIPFIKEYVQDIDFAKQIIFVDAPTEFSDPKFWLP